ncbi:MAG: hypothetical protein HY735_00300 [Verrucomicrobia bacterium]|nr:hypothetical protein [Verrucomicrobiota bacterium]
MDMIARRYAGSIPASMRSSLGLIAYFLLRPQASVYFQNRGDTSRTDAKAED